MRIDRSTTVWSDCAELVLFEQDEIKRHAGLESDWCSADDVQLALANQGLAVFILVGSDGGFSFRLTTGDLTEREREAVAQEFANFWLDVKGHELRFGGLEVLPNGEGGAIMYLDDDEFERIPCELGRYQVEVSRLITADYEDSEDADETSGDEADGDAEILAYVVRLLLIAPGSQPPQLNSIPDFSPLSSA